MQGVKLWKSIIIHYTIPANARRQRFPEAPLISRSGWLRPQTGGERERINKFYQKYLLFFLFISPRLPLSKTSTPERKVDFCANVHVTDTAVCDLTPIHAEFEWLNLNI